MRHDAERMRDICCGGIGSRRGLMWLRRCACAAEVDLALVRLCCNGLMEIRATEGVTMCPTVICRDAESFMCTSNHYKEVARLCSRVGI